MQPDYQKILSEIIIETRDLVGQGKVADYIPSLARVDKSKFGIAIATLDGQNFQIGDADVPFSIQSISKVFVLTLVLREIGSQLWARVGREPSGNAFNSLVQLESENGIPRNPFINAGAMVTTDCLLTVSSDPLQYYLDFVRQLSGNPEIQFDETIARSEQETGYRNAALVNFLKSFTNIHNDVDKVLDLYFHHCATMMSCKDLANAFLFLANAGINPHDDEMILSSRRTKRVNALMQTCGFYDESGEFAFSVGLPGKSGVGGGIVAVFPRHLAICVWSPGLNKQGNSLAGMKALELFTTKTGLSIF